MGRDRSALLAGIDLMVRGASEVEEFWDDRVWERAAAEARPPVVGTRVVFVREFGEYPMSPMPAGLSGEVVEVTPDAVPCIVVRLDQHVEQLAEWDNEYHFSGFNEDLTTATADYREVCREVYVPRPTRWVEGQLPDGTTQPDGESPPFLVFDGPGQRYLCPLAGGFPTRREAEAWLARGCPE